MLKISENVFCYRLLHFFNVFIIKGRDGDVLIDTGFLFCKHLLKKIIRCNNIKSIILTHAHIDHIWNVSFIKSFTNAKVYISQKDFEKIDNSKINPIPVNKNYKYRTKLMKFGMNNFIPKKFNINQLLNDKDVINDYGIKLTIYELPGHTMGSIGILYKNILFVGDAIVNRKSYVEMSYQMENKELSLSSVNKIYDLKPLLICCGHEKPFNFSKLEKSLLKINMQ